MVIPDFKGEVAKGYVVSSVSVIPSEVTIEATESSLAKITTLQTAPIDLTDKRESFQISVPVVLTNVKFLKKITPLQVKVTVNIKEHFIKKTIKNIPIKIKTSLNLTNYNLKLNPSRINISYEISENFEKLIKKGDFNAFIELDNLDNNTVPIKLTYPEHIKNIKITPKFVKIKIEKVK